ncbi:Na+/H+ antiporter NhaA [uncultured Microbacterium sp.]|uniref:Na(+)/H(+) antiporter NhaA n=1 Tax=uncultured Microbacterium sp. TaxID=191216 RepID=A0A1Y5NUL7_9MICO|nr:Na+/H+ antiporter NhaA [uncultured Microbacterium sp.]SBS70107.1 Na(+)/H(+) antiporter NhaA 2 [uncultured Microbacterium sp.]
MSLLRSARFPAILLLAAAVAGLVLANGPLADAAFAVQNAHLGIPGTPLDLSVGHWISDGLLAVFFFTVSVELQYELTQGELAGIRRAAQPAVAALGGVLVPVAVYLTIVGVSGAGDQAAGWPIPTATDVAFALGVLAVFGRGLPSAVRVFLLALAILDDLIGILLIAVLFAHDVQAGWLLGALVTTAAVAVLTRVRDDRMTPAFWVVIGVLAIATWLFVLASGVHATIAGVLLGLAMAQGSAVRARHALEPLVNGLVLPLFALSAALVAIPAVGGAVSPAFWGVAVALPVGKLVGIVAGGALAQRLFGSPSGRLALGDLAAAAALGGIGFTVSLLLANLAFPADAVVRDHATLGVLAGSAVAVVASSALVAWRAAYHRRLSAAAV